MSYKSPIHLFELSSPGEELIRKITKAVEDEKVTYVYEYVGHLGIDVDKEELLRALKYDRDQYGEGHFDGYFEAMNEYEPRWTLTTEGLPESKGNYLVTIKVSETCNYVGVSYFEADDEGIIRCPNGVIAWMPLPEPYEERKGGETK